MGLMDERRLFAKSENFGGGSFVGTSTATPISVPAGDGTMVAPRPRGIVDPRTGEPAGADDPYFRGLNEELSDKGFIVTAADDLITWARTGSLMWMDLRPGPAAPSR